MKKKRHLQLSHFPARRRWGLEGLSLCTAMSPQTQRWYFGIREPSGFWQKLQENTKVLVEWQCEAEAVLARAWILPDRSWNKPRPHNKSRAQHRQSSKRDKEDKESDQHGYVLHLKDQNFTSENVYTVWVQCLRGRGMQKKTKGKITGSMHMGQPTANTQQVTMLTCQGWPQWNLFKTI